MRRIASTCVVAALWATAFSASCPSASAASHDRIVACASTDDERQRCPADTSHGVVLVKSTGPAACELGTTWGYDAAGIWVSRRCSAEFSIGPAPAEEPHVGRYKPGAGFTVADAEQGQLVIRLFSEVRYLNQRALDETYTDAFGNTKIIDRRQDIQLNKVNVYFQGWVLNPKFRYLAYVWTTNTSQGLGAQVVVGGNLGYKFNDHIGVYAGIGSLPGTRSTSGNFPYWLGVDDRLVADEFFRPSYTSGIWAMGKVADGLTYEAMLGNNLSQLGVDAGQLDNTLDTVAATLAWFPTTKEFGRADAFGDFDGHEHVATRLAVHFTRSDENKQSQPGTEAIENSQIRLSDGSVVFTPGLFGDGISITDVRYRMTGVDAGVKYWGMALEGEYYWRVVDDLRGPGVASLPVDAFHDHGFQLQASAMLLPKSLQAYVSGSKIFGEYGDPWDFRVGGNWYPWKNQVVRANGEMIYLRRSPVGALSLPFTVGGNGPVFHANLELYF